MEVPTKFRVGDYDYELLPLPQEGHVCILERPHRKHEGPFYRVVQNGDLVCWDCCRPMTVTQKGIDWLKGQDGKG